MYTHCLFCKSALGANESIEYFPVGKRLAFDPGKGRLWVVCLRCQRWNLTPIEERWEAVEECERHFRGARMRAQTDNIGMARLRDGTELVRIGSAERHEFATWRYGRIFSRRMRRSVLMAGGGTTAIAAGTLLSGAPAFIASVSFLPPLLLVGGYLAMMTTIGGIGHWASTRVVGQDDKPLKVTRADLEHMKLTGSERDPFRMVLKHSYGRQELTGEAARRAMGALLTRVNRSGAAGDVVRDATEVIADAGSPEKAAASVAAEAMRRSADFDEQWREFQRNPFQLGSKNAYRTSAGPINRGALPRLPAPQRLALEMALHEETERRALEGELALLEAAWREAEEIAAIADDMFAPPRTP